MGGNGIEMYILHFVWVPLLQIGLGLVFKDVHFILALAVLFLKWSYFDSDLTFYILQIFVGSVHVEFFTACG